MSESFRCLAWAHGFQLAGCSAAWFVLYIFFLWLCETEYMCNCVHAFRGSLISMQGDVMPQQRLGGKAEWSDFLFQPAGEVSGHKVTLSTFHLTPNTGKN